MSERGQPLTGIGAHDPREMALIHEAEIGREDRQILVPVGQAFECDRDANSIPELRERHPSDLGKDAADVEARVTERLGQGLSVAQVVKHPRRGFSQSIERAV